MSFWSFIGLVGKKEFDELQSNISMLIEENRLLREDNKKLFELIIDENDKCVEKMAQQLLNEHDVINVSIQDTHVKMENLLEVMGNTHRAIEELKLLQNANYNETVIRITNYQQGLSDFITKIDKEINGICYVIQEALEENEKGIIENIQTTQEQILSNINSTLTEIKNKGADIKIVLEGMKEQDEKMARHILINKDILNDNASRLLRIVDKFTNIDKQTDSIEEIQNKVIVLVESVQNLWTIMKLVLVDSLVSDMDSLTK